MNRPSTYLQQRGLQCLDGPHRQEGKLGWIALWLLGIPIPVLLVLFSGARLHLIRQDRA